MTVYIKKSNVSLTGWRRGKGETIVQGIDMQTGSLLAALSSFRAIYLNIDDKVSPSGSWRDTLALSADVQRHGTKRGVALKCNGFCL